MRIARIVEGYPSTTLEINRGLMPNIHYLSTLQKQMGHDVTIYTIRHRGQSSRQELDGIPIIRIERPRMTRTFFGLRTCQMIRKAGDRPDIIHAMNPLPLGWLYKNSRRILPTKYVLSVHGSLSYGERIGGIPSVGKFYIHEFRKLLVNLASEADLVLPVSNFVRRELQVAGVDPRRIRVIASGVETESFSPREEETEGVAKLLYVGRFSTGKGLVNFLRAIRIIQERHRVRVTLIGGSPMDDGYSKVLSERRRLRLEQTVDVREPIAHSSLPALYCSHDILVLPSEKEALGKVLLEAMACARPVVATRVGGVPDIVDDGKNGLLVPPSDPVSLATALEELILNDQRRRRMGLIARRKAVQFDWHVIARRYLEAFQSVL